MDSICQCLGTQYGNDLQWNVIPELGQLTKAESHLSSLMGDDRSLTCTGRKHFLSIYRVDFVKKTQRILKNKTYSVTSCRFPFHIPCKSHFHVNPISFFKMPYCIDIYFFIFLCKKACVCVGGESRKCVCVCARN